MTDKLRNSEWKESHSKWIEMLMKYFVMLGIVKQKKNPLKQTDNVQTLSSAKQILLHKNMVVFKASQTPSAE